MLTRSRAWVVVAGAGDVRIVTPSADEPGFAVVAEFGVPQDYSADDRERTPSDHTSAFLRSVSAHISREAARGAFDHLLLFAPPSPLAEIRASLAAAAQDKIRKAEPLDLSAVALDGLSPHLEPHLAALD